MQLVFLNEFNNETNKFKVLAFTGAPASFPVQKDNINLQQYLVWSEKIDELANKFIKETLPQGSFIGIHMRNGIDWVSDRSYNCQLFIRKRYLFC